MSIIWLKKFFNCSTPLSLPISPTLKKGIFMSEKLQNWNEPDIEKAKRICKEISENNNKQAILELYNRYHQYFMAIARKKLYDSTRAEDVVADYWVELTHGKAICAFEARDNASLKNYLTTTLIWRVCTANKNTKTDIERRKDYDEPSFSVESDQVTLNDDSEPPFNRRPASKGITPISNDEEDRLIEAIHRDFNCKIALAGLARLKEINPRCAELIKLHMMEYSNEEKAKAIMKVKIPLKDALDKEIDKIKHEINKKGAGSCQKKLQIIIKRQLAAI